MRDPAMYELFRQARLCIALGILPDPGGLNDQNPVFVDALEVVLAEHLAAQVQSKR